MNDPTMVEEAYDEYLKELGTIQQKLAKELTDISKALDDLISFYGISDTFALVTKDILDDDYSTPYPYYVDSGGGVYACETVFDKVMEKRRAKIDIMKKMALIREKIKDVKRNKERIFIEKAPGYELLRGE